MQWEQNLAYHLDVVAENVWFKNRQKAFFDVEVSIPFQDLM